VGYAIAAVVGGLLALGVLVNNYRKEHGMDGPCSIGSDWVPDYEQAQKLQFEYELVPPGGRCRVYDSNGSLISEKRYPQPGDWAVAGLALMAPFGVVGAYRLRRREPTHGD
jgi:hypothetical protein